MQTNFDSTTLARETELIAAARLGETSGLVEYLYTEFLPVPARKLARMFRESCGAVLDVDDLIQAGAEQLLRRLDAALTVARCPIGFLKHAAQFAMLDYCQDTRSSIRVPARSQRNGKRGPEVLSLDAPLVDGEDLTLLDLLAS